MLDRFAIATVTPAAGYAVSVAELKEELAISDGALDAQLERLILEATSHLENATARQLLTATLAEYLDCFPWELSAWGLLTLHVAPVITVSSISYVDTAGVTQTWGATNYTVDVKSEPARIALAYGKTVPSTYEQMNAVTITYTAGYGAAAAVPSIAKEFILDYCRPRYERRPPTADEDRNRTRIINELTYTL